MEKCPFCGMEFKSEYYREHIIHLNCIFNLDNCKTSKDFIKLITGEIESIEDAETLKQNLECVKIYLLNKNFSVEFIQNVVNGCNKYLRKFKSEKILKDTALAIVNELLYFEESEQDNILHKVKCILWNEHKR